jgi:hypothetical protein
MKIIVVRGLGAQQLDAVHNEAAFLQAVSTVPRFLRFEECFIDDGWSFAWTGMTAKPLLHRKAVHRDGVRQRRQPCHTAHSLHDVVPCGGVSNAVCVAGRLRKAGFGNTVCRLPRFGAQNPLTVCGLQGLKALHHRRLLHRDLKLENVLLDGKDDVKIGDLGFACTSDKTDGIGHGTPLYRPPEWCEAGTYSPEGDVWVRCR